MRKYRIENYGIYKNIFDVQMNTWWCGWITIKTFVASDICTVCKSLRTRTIG